ncbi:hypothetical protein Micbo1qcDRAFT_236450 [Microdochium bolleyi]|uniref:F-box domain-containing protein n=1 Tax=Microdochium bolleyi TaxID=196109 RepID=A0A136IQQ2_9PEZI|nr:hypothetical protein Micbo1qcDRAFT_236450 [Microdochium bolleyi]
MEEPQVRHGASFRDLPYEVFGIIVNSLGDHPRSLKALRLVSTHHDDQIVHHLFRRVSLSMLKTSVHSFTSIAAHPHLARHVRVLLWQDLPSTDHLSMFEDEIREAGPQRDSRRLAELFRLREQVRDRVASACWMRDVDGALLWHRAYFTVSSEYFRSWFVPALASMPQLNKLVIEAMHRSTRIRGVVDPRDGKRPVTAEMLSDPNVPRAVRRVNRRSPQMGEAASMLTETIRQKLEEHVCEHSRLQAESRALASVWETNTEDSAVYNSFTYGTVQRDLWSNVTSLDLKIDRVDAATMRDVCGALSAARGLTRLGLISETRREASSTGFATAAAEDFLLYFSEADTTIHNLQYLRLEKLNFSTDQLVSFVWAHRATLIGLGICDCAVSHADIEVLRENRCPAFVHSTVQVRPWQSQSSYIYRWPLATAPGDQTARGCVAPLARSQPRPGGRPQHMYAGSSVSLFVEPYRFSAEAFRHRWMWARTEGDETVYYWPATGALSEPTSVWKLTHGASGETRYGSDPRVFWPDWDEDQAGDAAEPTPFCREFRKFVNRVRWTYRCHPPVKVPKGATRFDEAVQQELVRQQVW